MHYNAVYSVLGYINLVVNKICEEIWYWPKIIQENSRKTDGSNVTQLQSS
jgi:hypothetical protein